jgi:hypothetical protein
MLRVIKILTQLTKIKVTLKALNFGDATHGFLVVIGVVVWVCQRCFKIDIPEDPVFSTRY